MTFYRDAAGLVGAVHPVTGSTLRSVALVVVAAARASCGGETRSTIGRGRGL